MIDEPNQFKVVENGSIETVNPTNDTYRIVAEELENQTNTEVLYFRTEHYHPLEHRYSKRMITISANRRMYERHTS